MTNNIIIKKDIVLSDFLLEAIPKLSHIPIAKTICQCGAHINLPIIVSEKHYEAFEELLALAAECLEETGVVDLVLEKLMDKINSRLNIQ